MSGIKVTRWQLRSLPAADTGRRFAIVIG